MIEGKNPLVGQIREITITTKEDYYTKYHREYYEKNREYIRQQYYTKKKQIECECGSVICDRNLSRHLMSDKHRTYLFKNKNNTII